MKTMLKKITGTKIILLPLIIIPLSLGACSSSSKTTQNQSDVETTSSSEVAKVQVENLGEVTFKDNPQTTLGVFDVVNKSSQLNHTISQGTPITIEGWAALKDINKPADQVIITVGEENTVIAVAPVAIVRQDVAKTLNNPALEKSGWRATIERSKLDNEKVVLKAWSYNKQTKEAFPINQVHTITFK